MDIVKSRKLTGRLEIKKTLFRTKIMVEVEKDYWQNISGRIEATPIFKVWEKATRKDLQYIKILWINHVLTAKHTHHQE